MERDPQGSDSHWRVREKQLYKHQRMVYAKMPLGGPAQVLAYLSRYAHPTAISNERIRHVSEAEGAFNVRVDDKGGKRLHSLDGVQVVRQCWRFEHLARRGGGVAHVGVKFEP